MSYGALKSKSRLNFERDIKSMHLIQGNRKRNSTTGRSMRPYQWILILTPSLLQMQGIIEQCLDSFLRRLVQTCQFSMIKSYTGDKLKTWIDDTNGKAWKVSSICGPNTHFKTACDDSYWSTMYPDPKTELTPIKDNGRIR